MLIIKYVITPVLQHQAPPPTIHLRARLLSQLLFWSRATWSKSPLVRRSNSKLHLWRARHGFIKPVGAKLLRRVTRRDPPHLSRPARVPPPAPSQKRQENSEFLRLTCPCGSTPHVSDRLASNRLSLNSKCSRCSKESKTPVGNVASPQSAHGFGRHARILMKNPSSRWGFQVGWLQKHGKSRLGR